MIGHIKQMIPSCVPCREHLPSQAHVPTAELLTAAAPMEAISMDLFYNGGHHYLDRVLAYLWIFALQNLDTRAVIQCLQKLMNSFGYARMVFSDNRLSIG